MVLVRCNAPPQSGTPPFLVPIRWKGNPGGVQDVIGKNVNVEKAGAERIGNLRSEKKSNKIFVYTVCMYGHHFLDQPYKVANPTSGQPNREKYLTGIAPGKDGEIRYKSRLSLKRT